MIWFISFKCFQLLITSSVIILYFWNNVHNSMPICSSWGLGLWYDLISQWLHLLCKRITSQKKWTLIHQVYYAHPIRNNLFMVLDSEYYGFPYRWKRLAMMSEIELFWWHQDLMWTLHIIWLFLKLANRLCILVDLAWFIDFPPQCLLQSKQNSFITPTPPSS